MTPQKLWSLSGNRANREQRELEGFGVEHWHCLAVTIPREAHEAHETHETIDAVSNFLLELGATGVVEGDHDPAKPLPPTTTVQAYFPEETSGPDIYAALEQYLSQLSSLSPNLKTQDKPSIQLSQISSEAWHEQWRGHFPPIDVGFSFLILPPWETPPTRTDRKVIVIDPSMAFGTGHHATTQGCLEAIESLSVSYGPPQRALDVGTGSGILAIALAQLGCSDVWAIDTDPIALDETRKNLTTNAITSGIHLSQETIESLPGPFPLLVANLFAKTLIDLAPTLAQAVTLQGYAIVSGIQVEQAAEVEAAFVAPTWQAVSRLDREEWVTLVYRRGS